MNNAPSLACHYAIVRLVPIVETEEFANVGVVLFSPQARLFAFRLLGARFGRITAFFEQLDAASCRAVMRDLREELERVAQSFRALGVDSRLPRLDVAASQALWADLLHPRESLLRFSSARVVMATDPRARLDELFSLYVERQVVPREHREHVLERSVRSLLRTARLGDRFVSATVGNDEYHARFPFVQLAPDDERPVKAIKALSLTQSDPVRIIDHGGQWIMRLHALRKRGLLPPQVLFAVDGDDQDVSVRGVARRDVIGELRALGVRVVPLLQRPALLDFAAGD
ncbi:DUF3037 domain-containing protein [Sphaerotilus sp.]|uniref:DUF3037 domain-containing protein n=1 Tax=Sphaerotilus sp. TaxID=2093942 RepID=UPI0034E2DCB2